MRSEYVDAVNAVRWGWSLWLALLAPAVLIWSSVLPRRRSARRGLVHWAMACVLFYVLSVSHSNRIQEAKGVHMQTPAEEEDWGSDTWHVNAPISAMPYAVVYCTIQAALAIGATKYFQPAERTVSRLAGSGTE